MTVADDHPETNIPQNQAVGASKEKQNGARRHVRPAALAKPSLSQRRSGALSERLKKLKALKRSD